MSESNQVVSFEDELLILVDENDSIIDHKTKEESHNGDGILHRAFSVFIFDDQNRVLMQKRSEQKRLWPLYWSNSCCSHPRKGESYEISTQRRIKEELGISTDLKFLYKFQYQAKFEDRGSENELCSVYIGKSSDPISVNPNEIAEWKFVDISELTQDIELKPENYTPWLKMEWKEICQHYMADIDTL